MVASLLPQRLIFPLTVCGQCTHHIWVGSGSCWSRNLEPSFCPDQDLNTEPLEWQSSVLGTRTTLFYFDVNYWSLCRCWMQARVLPSFNWTSRDARKRFCAAKFNMMRISSEDQRLNTRRGEECREFWWCFWKSTLCKTFAFWIVHQLGQSGSSQNSIVIFGDLLNSQTYL